MARSVKSKGMNPLIIGIVVIVVAAVAFFLLRGIPLKEQSSGTVPVQDALGMTFDEVVALGASCFLAPLSDQSDDVEGRPDGSFEKVKPDATTPVLDIEKATIITPGTTNSTTVGLVFRDALYIADLVTPTNSGTNVDVLIHEDGPGDNDNRITISNPAATDTWTGSYYNGGSRKTTDFNPNVKSNGNTLTFEIPSSVISDNDPFNAAYFETRVYNKGNKTMYLDYLRQTGMPIFFTCALN